MTSNSYSQSTPTLLEKRYEGNGFLLFCMFFILLLTSICMILASSSPWIVVCVALVLWFWIVRSCPNR